MKRLTIMFISLCMCLIPLGLNPVSGEPDYTDSDYWYNKCTGTIKKEDQDSCKAYQDYVSSQTSDLESRKKELQKQYDAIKADLESYAAQIDAYQVQIEDYQAQINAKEAEIAAKQTEINNKQAEIEAKQVEINNKQIEIENKQVEIDAKQAEIDATQNDIDTIKDKVKTRMSSSQSSMRINKYLDILMGAGSFEQFLRIILGLNAISVYDQNTMNELIDLMEKLNAQMAELETVKAELEAVKAQMEVVKAEMEAAKEEMEAAKGQMIIQEASLIAVQDDLYAKQYEVGLIEQAAKEREAEYRASIAQIASDISSKNALMTELANAGILEEIQSGSGTVTTNGWTYPVPGAHRSAGTWAYASGYEHLGYDFAAGVGSAIYAVGNGVVLSSANGCATYGNLGNMCGYQFGGAYGGGNQVHYLVVVDGSLYGIAAYHMQLNSPIAAGTVVSAGTQIGRVGSSGNSSGPHCHIEIIYLGSGSNFSHYAQTWNGDLAFGAGWQGNNRKCDHGYGAPCRIRPESIFGY